MTEWCNHQHTFLWTTTYSVKNHLVILKGKHRKFREKSLRCPMHKRWKNPSTGQPTS